MSLFNPGSNRIICPYCGYRLQLPYSFDAHCSGIWAHCKGRNCGKWFRIIVRDGVQKNLVPNVETIEAFKQAFGSEYEKHILDSFGVVI